ncbi:MAG: hypothetical protein AAGF23_26190, partial [Acidobacteriota bacterium]
MLRFRNVLAAWSLVILGPLFMLAPLINPEVDKPVFAVGFGLVMTVLGVLMVRGLAKPKAAEAPQAPTAAAPSSDAGDQEPLRWASNAPDTWPRLVTPPDVPGSPPPILTLRTTAEFKRLMAAESSSCRLAAMAPSYLVEGGLLEANMEIVDGDRRVPVMVYADGGPEASSHFAGVRRVLGERGLEPVYFAPAPLDGSATPSDDVARPAGLDAFTLHTDDIESGHYSMWWPTPGDEHAPTSPCLSHIDRCYRAMDGKEAYFVGFLLHELGTLEEARPAQLPEELDVFAAFGPERRIVLFSMSAEKGFRLHFHEGMDAGYRDRLLRQLADFCEHFRGQLD